MRTKLFKKIGHILKERNFLSCEKDTIKFILRETPRKVTKVDEIILFKAALRWSINQAYTDLRKQDVKKYHFLSPDNFSLIPANLKRQVRVYMAELLPYLRLKDVTVTDFLDVIVPSSVLGVSQTRQLALDILHNHRDR